MRPLLGKTYPASLIVFSKSQRGTSVIIKYEKHSCITRSFIIYFLRQMLLTYSSKKDEMGGGAVHSVRELKNAHNFLTMAKHRHKAK